MWSKALIVTDSVECSVHWRRHKLKSVPYILNSQMTCCVKDLLVELFQQVRYPKERTWASRARLRVLHGFVALPMECIQVLYTVLRSPSLNVPDDPTIDLPHKATTTHEQLFVLNEKLNRNSHKGARGALPALRLNQLTVGVEHTKKPGFSNTLGEVLHTSGPSVYMDSTHQFLGLTEVQGW
ncbi:hypothetical protein CYLTODRAFT_407270 [Cylindrobasidium torrendii FP15055 ss-10]|uniref:Uncharacterized protein n=1 Tax=Cylindrobasidium torrendii FP15055 ss-10 TaxID=1314674 RepID=A0A0D7BPR3_9AGAR|nr:hypothetical protein CYLTODRAFT_407270 [Cylindrobasidium torrendii FP15055 ss-10]